MVGVKTFEQNSIAKYTEFMYRPLYIAQLQSNKVHHL
jgi:hypothetical protein